MPDDPRADVITAIGCIGGSWRWRTKPLNYKPQPACNVVCRRLICLPFSNIQNPYTQNPCHTRIGCICLASHSTIRPTRTPGPRMTDPLDPGPSSPHSSETWHAA